MFLGPSLLEVGAAVFFCLVDWLSVLRWAKVFSARLHSVDEKLSKADDAGGVGLGLDFKAISAPLASDVHLILVRHDLAHGLLDP